MTYSPAIAARGAPYSINSFSFEAIGYEATATAVANTSSQNWIAANQVVYVPFSVVEPLKVTKLWWENSSPVAGNIDLGVYDINGNLLVSTGSIAQAGTSAPQTVDVTDTGLDRGRYYFGMVSDTSGVTQKVMANVAAAGIWQAFGLLQQASVTLPLATNASPATFAKYTSAFAPMCGLLANRVLSL